MKLVKHKPAFDLICLLLLVTGSVSANDSAIIVFDGSGSMWGQVDNKPKIVIAREVMGTLVQDWNEDIDLGLMVYGHREKGQCDDIEMVIPVGKSDPAKLLDAINGITPKGETPIGASLMQAAKKLNYVESPATVILISDGEESCDADPCAVANELKKNGIDFIAHVIGFDVSGEQKAKAQQQLKCVAENTGGKYFEAKNAEGLRTALAETAKVVVEPIAETAPEKQASTGPGSIKLHAVPAEGAEPFTEHLELRYYIYENKKGMDGKRKEAGRSAYAEPVFELEPGNYLVVAERNNARVETTLEVIAGETVEHTFNLNSGNLQLRAVATEGADPFTKHLELKYHVYEDKKGIDGKRKSVGRSLYAEPLFKLKAGRYLLTAERGNARVEAALEVVAGEMLEHTFNLNSGNLQLHAVPTEGAQPFTKHAELRYNVYEDKKSMDGNRKQVDRSFYAEPMFKLKAGQYFVTVKRDNTQVEATLEVKAGELAEHTFVVPDGAE